MASITHMNTNPPITSENTNKLYTNIEGYLDSTYDIIKSLKDQSTTKSGSTNRFLYRSIAYGNIFRGYLTIVGHVYKNNNNIDIILDGYFSAKDIVTKTFTITNHLKDIKVAKDAIDISNYKEKIEIIYPRLVLIIGFTFALMEVLRGKGIAYKELFLAANIMLEADLHIDRSESVHINSTTASTTERRGDIDISEYEETTDNTTFNILNTPETQRELDIAIASINTIYNQIEPVAKFIADNLAKIKADYNANPIGDLLQKLTPLLESNTTKMKELQI